jgi:sugar phosphate isomerase/epimerase
VKGFGLVYVNAFMDKHTSRSRREFLKASAALAGTAGLTAAFPESLFGAGIFSKTVPVSGHLWVYASRFPPDWDSTPILEEIFSDFRYAGMEGLELMEINLRRADAVSRLNDLSGKYRVPVTGTSYNGDMWNREKHSGILEDVEVVVERLRKVGGSTFGISVGDARRPKTEAELDAQADLLKKIRQVCDKNKVVANLHNHTYEVSNNLHDLKGTLQRIPDFKLGPDLNWLIRGGVDPVWFINTYGKQMVYLHIRDQRSDGRWSEAVGEGSTDFPAIVQALKKADFRGRAAIELAFDGPPEKPVRESWKQSRDYVRQVFGW